MVEMMWHGHRVTYGPSTDNTYCRWTTKWFPDDLPWPPPRPDGYICDHTSCNNLPVASEEVIQDLLLELLYRIGAKPGEYLLKGTVPESSYTGRQSVVIFTQVSIK